MVGTDPQPGWVRNGKEKIMPDFGGMADKAKDMAGDHSDKVDQGIEKAGDTVDDKTGNKFEDQVDKGQDAARDRLGGNE